MKIVKDITEWDVCGAILSLMVLCFLILKVCCHVNLSWVTVFAPFWFPPALVIVLVLGLLLGFLLTFLIVAPVAWAVGKFEKVFKRRSPPPAMGG